MGASRGRRAHRAECRFCCTASILAERGGGRRIGTLLGGLRSVSGREMEKRMHLSGLLVNNGVPRVVEMRGAQGNLTPPQAPTAIAGLFFRGHRRAVKALVVLRSRIVGSLSTELLRLLCISMRGAER